MYEVLSSGEDGGLFRAWVFGRDSEKYLVVSDVPLEAQTGDDVFLTGVFLPQIGKNIPREFKVGAAPEARLRKILAEGAITRSFGKKLSQSPRPLQIFLEELAPLGASVLEVQTKDGVDLGGILRLANKSSDPVLNWGAELVKTLPRQHNLILIDPKALLPYYEKGRVTKAAVENESDFIFNRLQMDFPALLSGELYRESAYNILDGLAHMQSFHNSYVSRFIVPYNIFETNSRLWAGATGLPNNAFAMKQNIDGEIDQYLSMAHELAHGFQDEYGFLGSPQKNKNFHAHLNENFADSFAILAVAQKTKDFKTLKQLADMRHAFLVSGLELSHFTGSSIDKAIETAEKLHKEGKLTALKPDELAKMAAKIAQDTALTPKTYKELSKMRENFYKSCGAWKDKKPLDRIKAWQGLRREIAQIKTGKIAEKESILAGNIWRFERALDAIDNMCYTPKDLQKQGKRTEALAFYEADLFMALEKCDGHTGQARAILDIQHKQFTWQGRYFEKKGLKPQKMEVAMLEGRLKIIKKARRKVNLWDAKKDVISKEVNDDRITALMIKRRPYEAEDSGLKAAFMIAPKKRVVAYKKALFGEIKALRKLKSLKNDKKAFEIQQGRALKFTQKRHNIAFAIRVEEKGRTELDRLKETNPNLVRHLVAVSNNHAKKVAAERVSERLKNLEHQGKRF